MPPPSLSARPRPWWTKALLALLAPLAFFALLEGALRLGGFGRDTRLFIPDESPGMWRTNPRFTELFFPASFGLKPVNFRLTKDKPSGAVRIFLLGESAAMGVPEPAFALAPQLRAQLRAVRPGAPVEVCNLGVTAINSHAILEIARQAVEFEPDLLVVYMGNNEVVGPYGASSVVAGGTPPRRLIRAGLRLRASRTGQLLQRLVGALRPAAREFREWGGMEMFAGRTVAADDPRLAAVQANFAANLADILALARKRGIKTVLSTVAVNVRDSAPFASLPAGPLPELDRAELAKALGERAEERALREAAVRAQPGHADAHYRLARVLDGAGEMAGARTEYLEALRLDALRFRADARLNELIREAAARSAAAVTLVDAARALGSDAASTGAPAGRDHFFEHVHLTWEGNHALARLLAESAAAALWNVDPAAAPWLDATAMAEAVGFTPFGRLSQLQAMAELTGRPPFTGQSRYAEHRTILEREIGAVRSTLGHAKTVADARTLMDRALAADPENPALLFQAAALRLQTGDSGAALVMHERLEKLAPFSAEHAVQKAVLLQQVGRSDDAEALLRRAVGSEPFYFQTYPLLARLWVEQGRVRPALGQCAEWVARMPDSRVVRSTYAQLLAQAGDWPGAEREWREMLARVPDDETALAPFTARLAETGRLDAAVDLMQAAFAHNPRNYANNARLAQVAEARGDAAESVKYLQALAASGPVNAQLHLDLAAQWQRLRRTAERRAALLAARRTAEQEGNVAAVREAERLLRMP